ncbi:MAG: tetratricopeptide repeat protein [Gammaproteobacteria bacterium]
MGFWGELRRRRVYRMAGFYVVGAWIVIQVADVFFPAWGLPETGVRFLIIAAILCFPVALVFSWAFDITTSGIAKTEPAVPGDTFDSSLKRTDFVVLAALLAIGAVIVFGSLQKIVEEVDDAVAVAEKIDKSIAILPFANLDTNPETGYFSDGVTEEILHRLSSLKALHVLSRTSSFAFRDSNDGPARISEILGVRYLLHGSVRRDKNSVRVTARLIDETGYQVWSETFDRELEGIFTIQSEIANTVASHIERQIIPQAELPAGRTTKNMAAYDAYLVGRAFVSARTPGWDHKAIAAFEEAIRLDEKFAPPYAGLAIALSINNPDWHAVRESIARAAETAIELDPELAEGHAALGLALLNQATLLGDREANLERAERSLRQALELDPSLSMAFTWLAITLDEQGRYEEANAVLEQGLLIDPLHPVMSYNMADQLLRRGETERAEQLLLRLIYLPEPPWMAYVGLQRLYENTGRFDKALHWAKQFVQASANARAPGFMAMLAGRYERLGLTRDADYWVAIAVEHTPQPAQKFLYKAIQFQIRGDLAGIRAEIDKLHAALGTDMDGLHPFQAAVYAAANIYVENFDVGIEMLEGLFDVGSFSDSFDFNTFGELGSLHLLAYAYQQVGRDEEAEALLTRLHAHLNAHVVERQLDFGPAHHLLAQNFGLRGDFDAAADALEAAIEAGWLNYIWVMHDPSWAETIADPRIARMLEDVKVELERQQAVVKQVDAERDFRAEFEAMRSALGE